ncbi:MAG: preprotein translocase subunit YajC [Planctomycetota bacterium]
MTDASLQNFPLVPFLSQDAPGFQGRNSTAAPAAQGDAGTTATQGADGSNQNLGGGTGGGQTGGGGFGSFFLLAMLGLMAFMIVSSIFAGRKQKKQRAEMLSSMGKHDRVMTNGGMIGTIVEMKEREIVLRIDDESGARAHFSKDAVLNVLKSSGSHAEN